MHQPFCVAESLLPGKEDGGLLLQACRECLVQAAELTPHNALHSFLHNPTAVFTISPLPSSKSPPSSQALAASAEDTTNVLHLVRNLSTKAKDLFVGLVWSRQLYFSFWSASTCSAKQVQTSLRRDPWPGAYIDFSSKMARHLEIMFSTQQQQAGTKEKNLEQEQPAEALTLCVCVEALWKLLVEEVTSPYRCHRCHHCSNLNHQISALQCLQISQFSKSFVVLFCSTFSIGGAGLFLSQRKGPHLHHVLSLLPRQNLLVAQPYVDILPLVSAFISLPLPLRLRRWLDKLIQMTPHACTWEEWARSSTHSHAFFSLEQYGRKN